MTDKKLKLLYEYMGWKKELVCNLSGDMDCKHLISMTLKQCHDCSYFDTASNTILDSNSAWEVVQEMDNKNDAVAFTEFYIDAWWADSSTDAPKLVWYANPDNFFRCLGEWLESREKERIAKLAFDAVYEDKIKIPVDAAEAFFDRNAEVIDGAFKILREGK